MLQRRCTATSHRLGPATRRGNMLTIAKVSASATTRFRQGRHARECWGCGSPGTVRLRLGRRIADRNETPTPCVERAPGASGDGNVSVMPAAVILTIVDVAAGATAGIAGDVGAQTKPQCRAPRDAQDLPKARGPGYFGKPRIVAQGVRTAFAGLVLVRELPCIAVAYGIRTEEWRADGRVRA